jgi:Na+/melibiose symporter-like transporter
MSVIPALAAIIAIAALWFYELDKETVEQMTSDLLARRAK